jgi:alpha-D-ribose 1-methylphosphonate 5-triphosphate diphosphatase PhnM
MTTTCSIHTKFFDDTCTECKKEYAELKGLHKIDLDDDKPNKDKKHQQQEQPREYKEFTEERAKSLYNDLLLQFLRSSKFNENEASEKAKSIIRKQCKLRNIPFWSWL